MLLTPTPPLAQKRQRFSEPEESEDGGEAKPDKGLAALDEPQDRRRSSRLCQGLSRVPAQDSRSKVTPFKASDTNLQAEASVHTGCLPDYAVFPLLERVSGKCSQRASLLERSRSAAQARRPGPHPPAKVWGCVTPQEQSIVGRRKCGSNSDKKSLINK